VGTNHRTTAAVAISAAAWAATAWWCLAGDGVQDHHRAEWQLVLSVASITTLLYVGSRLADSLRRPADETYRAGFDAGYCQGLAAGLAGRDDVVPIRRTT
jgi:hypothetical protein